MSAEMITLAGRRAAEELMQATCTVTRTTKGVLNEDTGLYEGTSVTVYEGPCRTRFVASAVREADVQGQALARQEGYLSLPVVGSRDVAPDDVVTITSNVVDPEQVGQRFVIRGGFEQTHSTARRFPIEMVS